MSRHNKKDKHSVTPLECATFFLRNVVLEEETFDVHAGVIELQNITLRPDGCLSCVLPVTERFANRNRTLHGGMIAYLNDVVGSAAIAAAKRDFNTGVSVEINSTYCRPAPMGSKVEIVAKVIKIGKTLATVQVDLKLLGTEKIVATGRHVKFLKTSAM
mmetsp:Transcript_2283/g.3207  ORF Transcript_2283/g.3207 Transcript_2283/m.3207 type:complete len:159 (-) Transcript_2283:525-1001(-)